MIDEMVEDTPINLSEEDQELQRMNLKLANLDSDGRREQLGAVKIKKIEVVNCYISEARTIYVIHLTTEINTSTWYSSDVNPAILEDLRVYGDETNRLMEENPITMWYSRSQDRDEAISQTSLFVAHENTGAIANGFRSMIRKERDQEPIGFPKCSYYVLGTPATGKTSLHNFFTENYGIIPVPEGAHKTQFFNGQKPRLVDGIINACEVVVKGPSIENWAMGINFPSHRLNVLTDIAKLSDKTRLPIGVNGGTLQDFIATLAFSNNTPLDGIEIDTKVERIYQIKNPTPEVRAHILDIAWNNGINLFLLELFRLTGMPENIIYTTPPETEVKKNLTKIDRRDVARRLLIESRKTRLQEWYAALEIIIDHYFPNIRQVHYDYTADQNYEEIKDRIISLKPVQVNSHKQYTPQELFYIGSANPQTRLKILSSNLQNRTELTNGLQQAMDSLISFYAYDVPTIQVDLNNLDASMEYLDKLAEWMISQSVDASDPVIPLEVIALKFDQSFLAINSIRNTLASLQKLLAE